MSDPGWYGTAGEAATDAGMDTMNGTEKWRDGWRWINHALDYIAERTSALLGVDKGGTGATTAAQARVNLAAAAAVHGHRIGDILTDDGTGPYALALQAQFDQKLSASSGGALYNGELSPAIYSRAIGGNSVYITSGGLLGHVASTRRAKEDVRDAELDIAAIRQVPVRDFLYRAELALGGGRQIGVVAEELDDLGFDWLVGRDEAGLPMTAHYDRIGLLALKLAQHNADRLDELERRLEGMTA